MANKKVIFLVVAVFFLGILVGGMKPLQGLTGSAGGLMDETNFSADLGQEPPDNLTNNIESSIIAINRNSQEIDELGNNLGEYKKELSDLKKDYASFLEDFENKLDNIDEISEKVNSFKNNSAEITKNIVEIKEQNAEICQKSSIKDKFDITFIINFIMILFNLLAFSFWLSYIKDKTGKNPIKRKKEFIDMTR